MRTENYIQRTALKTDRERERENLTFYSGSLSETLKHTMIIIEKCDECQLLYDRDNFENKIIMLDLPTPRIKNNHSKIYNLQKIIDMNLNTWTNIEDKCLTCNNFLQQKVLITHQNKIIVLHLKLFVMNDSMIFEKRSYFKIQNDFKKDIDICGMRYSFLNAIIHKGNNINHGHYINVMRENDEWVIVDDNRIKILKSINFIENSYVILLEKID